MTSWDRLKFTWLKFRCLRFPIFTRPTRGNLQKSTQCVRWQPRWDHTHSADFRLGSAQPWSKTQNFIEYFSCRARKKKPNQQNKAPSRTPGDSYCKGRPALARDGWRTSSARRSRGAAGPPQQASKQRPAEGSVSRIAKAFCSESSPSPQQTRHRHCCPSLFSPNSPNHSPPQGPHPFEAMEKLVLRLQSKDISMRMQGYGLHKDTGKTGKETILKTKY